MIYLRLFSQDRISLVMTSCMLVCFLGILIALHFCKKKKEFISKKWKWICCIPFAMSLLHLFFLGFKGKIVMSLVYYGGIYIVSALIMLLPYIVNMKYKVVVEIISVVVVIILSLYTVAYPAITNSDTRNFSHLSYEESFEAMIDNIKKYDSVSKWKETDFDKLREEILPKIRKAEEHESPAEFYAALCEFTYYLYDGHSWVKTGSEQIAKEAEEIMAGNDYGFSMVRLDTGETIAVCVEKNSVAEKAGIHFGTVIKSWNGKEIDKAIEETKCIYTKEYGRWPVEENEEMYKPVFLAGKGEETVEVEFIDETGGRQSLTLSKIGNYRERLEKVAGIIQGKSVLEEKENFYTEMLNDTVGYIRILEEETTLFEDIPAYISGHNEYAKELLANKIDELKAKGMESLIIDVRNNTGGYTSMVRDWAGMFTKEAFFVDNMAYCEGDETEIVKEEWVDADGRYADIPTVVLTNSRCVSAGDYLVYCFGKCENVRVAGMTTSCGSSQPVGGNCVMTDCIGEVRFPVNWMLEENGDYFIDSKADRISRLPNDVDISFDYEAAKKMFEDGVDYELMKLMDF